MGAANGLDAANGEGNVQGLAALLFSSYVLLTLGGTAARVRAGTIYVVVNVLSSMLFLVALTLLPALLGLVKERICSPRARARQAGHRDRSRNPARRWVGLVVRYRWAAVVLVTAGRAARRLP